MSHELGNYIDDKPETELCVLAFALDCIENFKLNVQEVFELCESEITLKQYNIIKKAGTKAFLRFPENWELHEVRKLCYDLYDIHKPKLGDFILNYAIVYNNRRKNPKQEEFDLDFDSEGSARTPTKFEIQTMAQRRKSATNRKGKNKSK